MKKVGLLGKNINYSKSPSIHNKYYKDNNIQLNYTLFDTREEDLESFIKNLPENIIGFNVTVPYKEKIIYYLDEVNYPANLIKAVNTVVNVSGKFIGYNTDYFGFIKSLEENNVKVKDNNVLILGNGGASKAVYLAIKDLGAKVIDFGCRNIEKCKKEFIESNDILNINEIKDISKYDLVINATTLGNINNNISPITIEKYKKSTILYDLNYIPEVNEFLKRGLDLGLKVVNGWDMLYYQAVYSIKLWEKELNKI
ncbi:shikimate dehydrogenase family protein [Clostridium fallax]|uniref:Shikimate dehydrogenase n=1 Tax=Clostridium fallax TaxID=1533 RepID=A0A1M4X727_9CLOT|nr:shikimate dehydrogenase [Clostridium fallax]SHE89309.1 shikimate dehydrogenase [Clostridium fallax]SQB07336.1 shikimate dehydrogenase [Clostridium fallax]